MSSSGREDEFRGLFAMEAEQRLDALASQLLALEETGGDPELVASIFREAHTLKGAAAVVGLDEFSGVAHAMETVLEQLRSGDRLATPVLIDGVLAAVDGLRVMLPAVLAGDDQTEVAAPLIAALAALAEHRTDLATSVDLAEPADDEEPIPPTPAAAPTAAEATAPAPAAAPPTAAAPAAGRADAETVRVPLSRLDELIRLVGESAAAHLRVGRMIRDRLEIDPTTLDEVRELSRILNELQERAMRARMVPVVTITDVLQRAVREVARTTGKEVRWEVRGEDTELDRGVLQQLSDPLLHLVRNAVDHGIELPEERAALGKPEAAVVRFHAMQLGSR